MKAFVSNPTGLQSESNGRLWIMAGVSVFAHILLSPLPLLLGFVGYAFQPDPLDEPPVDEIPIELLSEEDVAPPPVPVPSAAAPAPAEPLREPAPKPVAEPVPSKADTKSEPKKPAEPPADRRDPVVAAGDAGKVVDSNANVRALLYMDRIREHSLGPRIGQLLRRTPQWGEFFGPAGVDPIRDVDRVLLAGPSLRNTANLVAVVEHHLPSDAVEAAFSGLVQSGGEWLSHEPLLARARADRADRLFASPGGRIVAVGPPSAEKSLKRLKKSLTFPAGPEGVVAQLYVKELTQLAKLFRISLPASLEAGRVLLRPLEDGGVVLEVSIDDTDKKLAPEHAEALEVLITRATEVDLSRFGALGAFAAFALGGSSQKFVQSVEFGAKSGKIEGKIRLTRSQLLTLLDLVDAMLPPEPMRKTPRAVPLEAAPGSTDAATLPGSPPTNPTEATPPTGSEPEPEALPKQRQETHPTEESAHPTEESARPKSPSTEQDSKATVPEAVPAPNEAPPKADP